MNAAQKKKMEKGWRDDLQLPARSTATYSLIPHRSCCPVKGPDSKANTDLLIVLL
jgi:hypothetical protein